MIQCIVEHKLYELKVFLDAIVVPRMAAFDCSKHSILLHNSFNISHATFSGSKSSGQRMVAFRTRCNLQNGIKTTSKSGACQFYRSRLNGKENFFEAFPLQAT